MNSFRKLVAGRTRSGVPRHVIEISRGDGRVQYECFDYEDSRQVLTRSAGRVQDGPSCQRSRSPRANTNALRA